MNSYKSVRSLFALCWLLVFVNLGLAQKKFTVEAIFAGRELAGKTVSGAQWMAGGAGFTYYQRDSTGTLNIWKYDCKTKKRSVLIDSKKVKVLSEQKQEKRFPLGNYFWSPDGKSILLPSKNDLHLYDLASGQTRQLTSDSLQERDPQFSPDSKKIAFVKNHNLHMLDLSTVQTKQLTTQGEEHIHVGKFDWVYEEEFGIRTGFFWSQDSRHIAYYQLDERQVTVFPLTDFIPIHNEYQPMRYPKAGDKNSIVKIGVVDVEATNGSATRWMDIGSETDIYIPRIKWTNDPAKLAILRLNRDQNHLELLLADIATGATQKIFEEKETNGWIDINDDWQFLKDGKFLWLSMADGFPHLYLYDMNGKLVRQITKGEWEVSGIDGVDEKSEMIFFTSTAKSLLERQLYKIKLDGSGLMRVSKDDGTHRINMSPDAKYYLDTFSNVTTTPRYSLYTNSGSLVEVVEPNEIPALKEYTTSPPVFGSLTTPRGDALNYWMIKPAKFDPAKKYPVLMFVYGGPGSQTVLNAWGGNNFYWYQILADKGYIIFSVDNRGTGARGKVFMMSTYKNLGALEVEDQISTAQWLSTQPYVDASRIGIWGWSYGGYMAASCILKGAEVFKTAISVAPVTDWRNYDTIYTERYMLTPEKNPDGYKNSAPVNFVKDLKGNLLLVHGLNDDNVHSANAFQLAIALQDARKPFSLMIYPRKDHRIDGRDTRVHLYNMMTDFLLKNL